MYNIKALYTTSDSFNPPSEVETIIELKTEDEALAKQNLARLKAHYEYYNANNKLNSFSARYNPEVKKKLETIIKEARNQPWFVDKYDFSVKLLLDNGKEYQIHAPYCGYFERLISLEIVTDNSDWKVSF